MIVAAGIGPFRKTPEVFSTLSPKSASHCYEGRSFSELGKRVVVIGAGQSALESAAIFHEMGIDVEVIARIQVLRWIGMHQRLHKLRAISKVLYSEHTMSVPLALAASLLIRASFTTFL